jgi:hypothetical protein
VGKFSGIFDEEKKEGKPTKRKAPAVKKAAAAPASRRGRGRPTGSVGGKRSDPNYTQMVAYVRRETHDAVKVALAPHGEISDLVQGLLDEWLKKH